MSRRLGGINRAHFACFQCRKSFKQPGSSNWNLTSPERPFPCPNCKRPMVRLGRYFKAPPCRAARQWLKIELMYCYGERFEASTTNIGSECENLRSTVAFLVRLGYPLEEVRNHLAQIRANHRIENDPA